MTVAVDEKQIASENKPLREINQQIKIAKEAMNTWPEWKKQLFKDLLKESI